MLKFQSQGGQLGGDNRVLASVYNATSSTLAIGSVVAYQNAQQGTGFDQFNVTTPTVGYLDMVAGVVSGNPNGTLNATSGIATATAGFIIIYGTATSIYQLAVSSSCTAGDRLVPVAGQTYLAFQTAGDGSSGHFCAAVTISSSSASGLFSTSVFVRCM